MPIIEPSNKLSLFQEEYRVCSSPFVFFRVIVDRYGARMMTATASEDTGDFRAFDDLPRLNKAAIAILVDREDGFRTKVDHAGRAYVESKVYPDKAELVHVATLVLDLIGFTDVAVLALREMKRLYNDFSVDDQSDEAYLRDGMWITRDGRLVQK